jgi:hypothetical protein
MNDQLDPGPEDSVQDSEEPQHDRPAEGDSPVLLRLRALVAEDNRRIAEYGSIGRWR